MPTANRRQFVPQAIRYFQKQDYPNKELVIIDDGSDSIADLVPTDPQVRYERLRGQRTLGAKRNECVEAARADLIMHWDDDDWMGSSRIRYQVDALLVADAEVCGLQRMLFYHLTADEVWLYQYPENERPWLAGGSLLYTRDFWRRSPFPAIQVASDTRFVWDRTMDRRVALNDHRFYVAMIHSANTSPKNYNGNYWKRCDNDLRSIMGDDLDFYKSMGQAQTAPSLITPVTPPDNSEPPRVVRSEAPTYSILMVVHNALPMTRLSTLQTLRRSATHDARLVVVDNGSNDGTEKWLQLLSQRGDIDLIRNESNLGHGPALELARSKTSSPYLVALDSDAFPLSDDWLFRLKACLNEETKVAGILHHRDYIHPSCLLIARKTMDKLKVTFLNEKDQPSQLDVAERISHELKHRGFRLAGLQRTGALRRGSVSEPVYLGSEYEGLVYHQWYTTRAEISNGGQVDDVPLEAMTTSLHELFARDESEPRSLTVVMGIRSAPTDPQRLENAETCLRALNLQDLERWRYRVILVEQDQEPRLERRLGPYADKYIFAYNPGPYNRGWAFNVGACTRAGYSGALCLIDADLLVSSDFLSRGLEEIERGCRALLPFDEVLYLDPQSTARAIRDTSPNRGKDPGDYCGRLFTTSQGGCIWLEAGLYHQLGGHDERFRGWGREDREFWDRVTRTTTIRQLRGRQLHLYHQRPAEEDEWANANQQLYDQLASEAVRPTRQIGNPQLYITETNATTAQADVARDWEHWHRWDVGRIRRVVQREQYAQPGESNRETVAHMLSGLGKSMLDVGCGPGALWHHFSGGQPSISCVGVDITPAMLRVAREFFPNIPALLTDAGSLPFVDHSFDLVLLRHVIEHLPDWLMERALDEALRVARNAVVLDFNVAPHANGKTSSRRVGDGFLETRWAAKSLEQRIAQAEWGVRGRVSLNNGRVAEEDVIWILAPNAASECSTVLSLSGGPLKVSIIMPTYRRAHTVFRTLHSISSQTYSNWELIIIDNAGSDEYYFTDPRIRVYRHTDRPSASYARNEGLRYVTGDLVCFFDDDDTMFPSYLEQFVKTFQSRRNAKMVRCGMIVSSGKTNYSYATPECCLRREFATPTWANNGPAHDQLYFKTIVEKNRWSESRGDIVNIAEALCRANTDLRGGLRAGCY
jgi:glycosyltransferase involved in cell wall biosynthesis